MRRRPLRLRRGAKRGCACGSRNVTERPADSWFDPGAAEALSAGSASVEGSSEDAAITEACDSPVNSPEDDSLTGSDSSASSPFGAKASGEADSSSPSADSAASISSARLSSIADGVEETLNTESIDDGTVNFDSALISSA